MNTVLMLARGSLWSRRWTSLLTILSVATSFALLIAVERLRTTTRSSFESTISSTDFLVGARGSELQLLLYSVFRIGEPVQEISWESYQSVASHPEVSWSVPQALGDSVRGFRVLGTTPDYFEYYRYGTKQNLEFDLGHSFKNGQTAVLGSEVARKLGWSLGQHFPLQHGVTQDAHAHEDAQFEVVGILAPTGTPVDRAVHVSLSSLAMVHLEHTEDEADMLPMPTTTTPLMKLKRTMLPMPTTTTPLMKLKRTMLPMPTTTTPLMKLKRTMLPMPTTTTPLMKLKRTMLPMPTTTTPLMKLKRTMLPIAHYDGAFHEAGADHDVVSRENEAAHASHAHNDHAPHEEHEHRDEELHGHETGSNASPQLETISAAMIGLRSKMGLFRMRAWINDFADEPLMAVMPARAFQRLWVNSRVGGDSPNDHRHYGFARGYHRSGSDPFSDRAGSSA